MIVAIKTFNWHSLQPATLKARPLPKRFVMLITVAATVSTINLAIGVLGGIIVMALLPPGSSVGKKKKIVASPRK